VPCDPSNPDQSKCEPPCVLQAGERDRVHKNEGTDTPETLMECGSGFAGVHGGEPIAE